MRNPAMVSFSGPCEAFAIKSRHLTVVSEQVVDGVRCADLSLPVDHPKCFTPLKQTAPKLASSYPDR